MARFERQEVTGDRLADTVGAATEQLRVALEREAVELISKAREEAAAIEEEARSRAAQAEEEARSKAVKTEEEARAQAARIEHEAHVKAEEARSVESDRIARLTLAVDALEERMVTALGDLRRQLESAAPAEAVSEPSRENGAAPAEPEAPAPEAEQVPEAEEVAEREQVPEPKAAGPATAFPRAIPLSVATEVDSATETNPVLDDMMRAQIQSMRENGDSREDAERFLGRFRLGESYVGLLDEIYPQDEGNRTSGQERGKRRRFIRRDA